MQWLEDIKNKLAYCSDLSASSQKDLEGKLETIQVGKYMKHKLAFSSYVFKLFSCLVYLTIIVIIITWKFTLLWFVLSSFSIFPLTSPLVFVLNLLLLFLYPSHLFMPPHPFLFIIHLPCCHLTLCNLSPELLKVSLNKPREFMPSHS